MAISYSIVACWGCLCPTIAALALIAMYVSLHLRVYRRGGISSPRLIAAQIQRVRLALRLNFILRGFLAPDLPTLRAFFARQDALRDPKAGASCQRWPGHLATNLRDHQHLCRVLQRRAGRHAPWTGVGSRNASAKHGRRRSLWGMLQAPGFC